MKKYLENHPLVMTSIITVIASAFTGVVFKFLYQLL